MTVSTWTGVVAITDTRYAMLAQLAGQWLVEERPEPILVGGNSGYEVKAIYIVVNREGLACYCGRTAPTRLLTRGAAATRLNQHVSRTRSKKEEWAEYWVIPLSSATPDHVVSDLERTVAARLGIPLVHRARIARRRA
ncbi:hypothetical protein C3492_43205 [Streptomyces sp. Ru62]|uniref:hypothetical protein n=1 Tax=Streptomyces sp. Ru62 TaxID=2080745 RepID=UPI000CDDCD13|nr:hypothetical protein [Streptomyces sp. Ru62]POX57508.1 hypothetical protein C3492_43205 [Streptomyces sp. Ru62]